MRSMLWTLPWCAACAVQMLGGSQSLALGATEPDIDRSGQILGPRHLGVQGLGHLKNGLHADSDAGGGFRSAHGPWEIPAGGATSSEFPVDGSGSGWGPVHSAPVAGDEVWTEDEARGAGSGGLQLLGRALYGPCSTRPFAAGDGVVWTGSGAALLGLDMGSPNEAVLLGSVHLPDHVYATAVDGDVAYCATYGSGLCVVDIGDPAHPRLAGQVDTGPNTWNVAVSGGLAYVVSIRTGLSIVDGSSPSNPRVVGRYPRLNAKGIFVDGTTAYVAYGGFGSNGLVLLDVSDPSAPRELGSTSLPGKGRNVVVKNGRAYVATWGSGLAVVDVRNREAPVLLNTDSIGGVVYDVAQWGETIFLANGATSIIGVDVSDPDQPVEVGTLEFSGSLFGLAADGPTLYAGDGELGLVAIDGSAPSDPVVEGAFDSGGMVDGVVISGGHAFLANWDDGLSVLDITDPTAPKEIGSLDTPGYAWDLVVSGDVAYLADDHGGLRVIDITDPENPTEISELTLGGGVLGVALAGDLLCVAGLGRLLWIVDVSDPAAPTLVGEMGNWQDATYAVEVRDGHAYVTGYDLGLAILDISNPAHPTEVGRQGGDWGLDIALDGHHVHVADLNAGCRIVNVSDPSNPIQETVLTSRASSVAAAEGRLYVGCHDEGLQVYDIADPARPLLLDSVDTPGQVLGLAVEGDRIYLGDTYGGFSIYQFSPLGVGGGTPPAVGGPLPTVGPNPFNPHTTVRFGLDQAGWAEVAVYDLRGARVRSLLNRALPAGSHAILWDGKNDHGRELPSSTYTFLLRTAAGTQTTRAILLK